ncbi:MAG: hypothetical protein ACLP7P_08580 [Rhodomicrobium sp.]
MGTVRDAIVSAYRRLGLLAPGEDLDPNRALAGLEMFNDMLASFQAEGSTIPAPASLAPGSFDNAFINDAFGCVTTPETGVAQNLTPPYGLNDAFPMALQFRQSVVAMLAVQVASESGIEAPATVQRAAAKGWKAILAYYVQAPDAQQDPGLTWMPSLRRYGFR